MLNVMMTELSAAERSASLLPSRQRDNVDM